MLLTTFVAIGMCVDIGQLGAPCSTELSDGTGDALLWYELQRERSDGVIKLDHCLMFIRLELITEGSPSRPCVSEKLLLASESVWFV